MDMGDVREQGTKCPGVGGEGRKRDQAEEAGGATAFLFFDLPSAASEAALLVDMPIIAACSTSIANDQGRR